MNYEQIGLEAKALSHVIASALPEIIKRGLAERNEDELVRQLRTAKMSDREKVELYLKHTEQNCTHGVSTTIVSVAANYVRTKLGLPLASMKSVLTALQKGGVVAIAQDRRREREIIFERTQIRASTEQPNAAQVAEENH